MTEVRPLAATQPGSGATDRPRRRPRHGVFSFPDPVNELAARTVAGGVLILAAATLVVSVTVGQHWLWLSVALAYGFLARVATGPTLSPLGQLATRVVAPRLGAARPVPGAPKRFAQAIGAVVTRPSFSWSPSGSTCPHNSCSRC
jgi:Domain of unknown function (DUF4395)